MELIVYGIVWIFALYGILAMIQDILRNYTYNKVKKNIKLIMTVKDAEDGIENYIRELTNGKNFYNNLVIIDLGSTDDTLNIIKELEKENINIKLLNQDKGKLYINNLL